MTSQKYFEEAWKNRKLVGGALKAAHVRPDYHLYEDLLQEGVILYAEMLRKLDGQKVRSEIDKLQKGSLANNRCSAPRATRM